MRNLRIVSFQQTPVEGDLPLRATAWDTNNDTVICAFGPTPTKPIIELKRKVILEVSEDHEGKVATSTLIPITSWDAPCPLPGLECDEILLMHYFPDNSTTCLILAGGDLVLVREEPEDGQEKIEIVGSVEVGIAAAAWASDEELLAIVTMSDTLVLMSRALEPITETNMATGDLQTSKHVSVGWGKKETQFQGKRAKAMRDPTIPEHIDEGLPSVCEDGRTEVSWRGDGAFLAINTVASSHRRVIRVYSREGALESVSEPVDGLESALSWRPAGNLIASIRRSKQGDDTRLEVIFFERNGLRHGEFPLRVKATEVNVAAKQVSLAWNFDSSVLAVSLMDTVQYWTMGNYHYYLKQEVYVATNTTDRPVNNIWHPEKPLKCCASHKDSLIDLEYLLQVCRGSTIKPLDYGIAAVIDGDVLKLTPFRHAGVPPPMSYLETQAGRNIIDVAISSDGQRLALLTLNGIEVCEWEMRAPNRFNSQDELRHTTNIRKRKRTWFELGVTLSDGMFPTQIIFRDNSEVFVLMPTQRGAAAQCFNLKISLQDRILEQEGSVFSTDSMLSIPATAQNLLTDIHQNTIWVQNESCTMCMDDLSGYGSLQANELPGGQANSAIFNNHLDPTSGVINGVEQSFHKISLTAKGSLTADRRVLARDCTSFVLTDSYLIYTTAQHLLKFIHLTDPQRMDIAGDTPEIDERCRSVEKGAKIITVIPSIYAVVLQMPRGNLETIYPRVLVLTGIRDRLSKLEYRSAFIGCQNHQVDLNILYDYLPDVFMSNVKRFIDELKKPSRVDDFISKLKEEDVTQTLYQDTLKMSTDVNASMANSVANLTATPHSSRSDKVNTICDAIIYVLKDKPGLFLQCIITAHVCKRPPDLPAALKLVSSLRQRSIEEADLAISHLCFLSDTNRLYDAALALYDLELTLLVAQNAQRDPREYMPFLQNLQSLPALHRQYQIDNYLHNYAKALTSLHALESFEEMEVYTVKHSLYTHAMSLYQYSPKHLARITTLYANHLASQSQHSAAATLYESLNLYDQAYPLYALAHQWRESLTCALLVPLDSENLRSLSQNLAVSCTEVQRDYRSAATIHVEYLSDPLTAAKLLCKGSYFADATRILSLHNVSAEIPSTIDTALGEKFSEIVELVADCKSQLAAQIPRIKELRVKKAEDPLAFYGGDAAAAAADGIDIPDNISLAPTDATTAGGQSLFTRYGGSQGTKFGGTVTSNVSRKTSKTKRREERKRARGKKGSVYEEEYLVASVGRLIERVNGVHDEVRRLVSGLLRRGMRERASRVGEVMAEIEASCEKAREEVWGVQGSEIQEGHNGTETNGAGTIFDETRPSGADGVYWDSQQSTNADAMTRRKDAPSVKIWKGDVLL